jgi:hypothetical protein
MYQFDVDCPGHISDKVIYPHTSPVSETPIFGIKPRKVIVKPGEGGKQIHFIVKHGSK